MGVCGREGPGRWGRFVVQAREERAKLRGTEAAPARLQLEDYKAEQQGDHGGRDARGEDVVGGLAVRQRGMSAKGDGELCGEPHEDLDAALGSG